LSVAGEALKSESQYMSGLKKFAESRNRDAARTLAAEFLKIHPKTKFVPDVKLILADLETSPKSAITRYRQVQNNFKFYKKNDYAQFRICEIHFLSADWHELKNEAQEGLIKFPASGYRYRFNIYLILSQMQTGEYEAAERECRRLIGTNHDYNDLAAALLLLAHLHKKTSGLSKQYIGAVREIASGFSDSDAMPAALFLLGDFYEQKKSYDESFSAYSDLIAKFQGSPEASEGGKRIKSLMKHDPKKVAYLPGKKIIEAAESIDISPEMDIPDEAEATVFYSISIGPFSSLKSAEKIKILLNEYEPVKIAGLKKGYGVYVSRSPDEETILKVKIRLAEEFGLNGRIVRVSSDAKNSYIYGE
jgi:hypothetical protein